MLSVNRIASLVQIQSWNIFRISVGPLFGVFELGFQRVKSWVNLLRVDGSSSNWIQESPQVSETEMQGLKTGTVYFTKFFLRLWTALFSSRISLWVLLPIFVKWYSFRS